MESSKKQEDDQQPFTSNLITQIQEEFKISDNTDTADPIAFLERELKIRIPADTKEELR